MNAASEEITAIFFQCCFISETQVLITVSIILGVFSWTTNFNWWALFLSGEGCLMQGIGFGRGGSSKKNHGMGGGSPHAPPSPPPPPIWETLREWVGRTVGIDVTLPSGISIIFNQ